MADRYYQIDFPDGTTSKATTSDQIRAAIKKYVLKQLQQSNVPSISVTSLQSGKKIDVNLEVTDIRYSLSEDITDFTRQDVLKKSYKPQMMSTPFNLIAAVEVANNLGENSLWFAGQHQDRLKQLVFADLLSFKGGDEVENDLKAYQTTDRGKRLIRKCIKIPGKKLPIDSSLLYLVLRYLHSGDSNRQSFLSFGEHIRIPITIESWVLLELLTRKRPSKQLGIYTYNSNAYLTQRGLDLLRKNIVKMCHKCIRQPDVTNLGLSPKVIEILGPEQVVKARNEFHKQVLKLVPKDQYSILLSASNNQNKYYRGLLNI